MHTKVGGSGDNLPWVQAIKQALSLENEKIIKVTKNWLYFIITMYWQFQTMSISHPTLLRSALLPPLPWMLS